MAGGATARIMAPPRRRDKGSVARRTERAGASVEVRPVVVSGAGGG
jgi:hypothetical protein